MSIEKNGRAIADNTIRLMTLQDGMSKLLEMQEKVLTKQELLELRSLTMEELLQVVVSNQKTIRQDLDRLYKSWDWDSERLGVM